MSVNSQQLEDEADALIKAINEPPKAPDDPEPADTAPEAADTIQAEAEVPAAKPESDPDASPAPADTDELEGLSLENSAERIRNAQARMTRATTEAAQLRRALSDFETDSQRLEDEVKRLQAELQAAPANPPATDTETNGDAGLDNAAENYPDAAGPLVETIKKLRADLAALKGTVTTREENLARRDDDDKRNRVEAAQEAHVSVIRAAHPDFQQVVDSDDFQGWAVRQSRVTKIILYGDGIQGSPLRTGGTAQEVNEVLTQYKQAVGSSKRTDAARDAASPTLRKTTRVQSNGRLTFTREQIAAMSPAEFSKNEAAIDAALAEGRVT